MENVINKRKDLPCEHFSRIVPLLNWIQTEDTKIFLTPHIKGTLNRVNYCMCCGKEIPQDIKISKELYYQIKKYGK